MNRLSIIHLFIATVSSLELSFDGVQMSFLFHHQHRCSYCGHHGNNKAAAVNTAIHNLFTWWNAGQRLKSLHQERSKLYGAQYSPITTVSSDNDDDTSISSSSSSSPATKNIAIVGGGLAGLSTAWFLLKKSIDYNMEQPRITIIDKALPGQGGASSVAGG